MLRFIYTASLAVLTPLVLCATALKGLRDPAYRGRLRERLGFLPTDSKASAENRLLWVHAVSVGEVQAAAALVRALLEKYPDHRLLMTTATPTGAQRVQSLFGDAVRHAYLPYDLPCAMRRFLRRTRPALVIVMEREIWPNLFRACARRDIPVLLASARISAKSALRHQRFARLFQEALSRVVVAAQAPEDAHRYRVLGAQQVQVTGNLKFDIEVPESQRQQGEHLRAEQFRARLVWTAGSTHAGEEDQLLSAHRRLREHRPDALLVLVPRHPDRFDAVHAWLRTHQVDYVARSRKESVTEQTEVLLVDTLGELLMFYAAADIAFVGGSMVPIGGHNMLEPAVLARPILVGPHNFNGAQIATMLLDSGAARQVSSSDSLAGALLRLADDETLRVRMGALGAKLVAENRGALDRLLQVIETQLRGRDA